MDEEIKNQVSAIMAKVDAGKSVLDIVKEAKLTAKQAEKLLRLCVTVSVRDAKFVRVGVLGSGIAALNVAVEKEEFTFPKEARKKRVTKASTLLEGISDTFEEFKIPEDAQKEIFRLLSVFSPKLVKEDEEEKQEEIKEEESERDPDQNR